MIKKAWYFTFGSDPAYPYGREDYVVVMAETRMKAGKLFTQRHPKRPNSVALNCAFMYGQQEWEEPVARYYDGREPVEIIEEEAEA